jgi:uncharacterized phiE125 gp8 family phage protein
MLKLVTPPLANPVSLEEAKEHLRVTGTAEDTYIGSLISAATEAVQVATRRQLGPATFDLLLGCFPAGAIELPYPPLQGVESVTYVATDGTEKELAGYQTDIPGGRILPAYRSGWPLTRDVPSAVTVRFVAGYPTGETPYSIRAAILLLVAGLYENRESSGPVKLNDNPAVDRLLFPFRAW